LLGVIEAEQTERDGKTVRNDRLIAATTVSHLYREVKKLDQLPPCVVDGVEQFFISYNQQAGKEFKPLHRGDPKKAAALVKKGGRDTLGSRRIYQSG